MATQIENLWPKTFEHKSLPRPVEILRQQGDSLRKTTKDQLYGEVLEGNFPSTKGVRFDFYVGVTDKQYRYHLLTIECGYLFDYPLTLESMDAGTTTRVSNEEGFVENIRLIFNAPTTVDLLSRMMTFAEKED